VTKTSQPIAHDMVYLYNNVGIIVGLRRFSLHSERLAKDFSSIFGPVSWCSQDSRDGTNVLSLKIISGKA